MLIMQELTAALTTPELASWARSEPTQRFLQILKDLVGAAQDEWLTGTFQSNRELAAAEHAAAHMLAQIVKSIEDAKITPKETEGAN